MISMSGREEYPYIEMKDLQDGNKFCKPSAMRKPSSGARFQEGDTLFARITPCLENGKICMVKGLNGKPGFGSTEFLVFRGKKNISNSDFVFYLSRWDEVRGFAESRFEGTSGRQRVPKNCFDQLLLNLPPLSEQTAIAEVLSSLDDKIDLLHRQNKTLEHMAESLFRQWFVEEAEEGWEVKKISDFASINSRTIAGNLTSNEILYLETGSITDGKIDNIQNYSIIDAPSRAQRIVSENDIVYSLIRPIQRHFGIMLDVLPNTIVSTGFAVISCDKISPFFIYLLITQDEIVEYFEMLAEGSTSAYPSLRPSDISEFEFRKPPEAKLLIFHQLANCNWQKIKTNNNQIETLTHLRDELLPKLMSGEISMNI